MQILRAKGYSFKDEVSYIKNCSDINYVFMDVNNYFIKSDVFVKGHFFRDINFVEVFLKDIL